MFLFTKRYKINFPEVKPSLKSPVWSICLGPMRRVDSLEKTDAGRDWGQEENGTTEDEMAGWHHGLDGCESE